MSIEGASPLHDALHAAIEADDLNAFNALLRDHGDSLLQQFETWLPVPQQIETDREAASRYAQSLYAIASLFEANDEPAFMQRINRYLEEKRARRWEQGVAEAQALGEAGEYATSSARLEQILAEMKDALGSRVDPIEPKILGSLGSNALHMHDYQAALDYNQRAYQASAAIDDEEGLAAYYDNLQSLRLIARLQTDPERARHLFELRQLICRAQDATDAGRYGVSLDILGGVLPALEADSGDEGFRALLPKVHGLMGFNEHRLGNHARAREQTALALQAAKDLGDRDGVRIYTLSFDTLGA